MARRAFPRRDEAHAATATKVLARHAQTTGIPIVLPVPIELIIEQTYRLEVLRDEIAEPPGSTILGALAPKDRRVVLNTRHQAMFDEWVGPERFTLAHELAHWVYDAEHPDQLAFEVDEPAPVQFCYHRDSFGLSDDLRIREINANKLAAHLLLPELLVRAVDITAILGDFRGTASAWGVSQTTLRLRLQALGLIDDIDADSA